MKTHIGCIPCFFRQAIEAADLAGADLKTQKNIVNKLCRELPKFSYDLCPSYMGRILYKIVIDQTKVKDPFHELKQKSNRLALKLYPKLKRKVKASKNRFFTALELAIAGNIIDFGVRNSHKVENELNIFFKGKFNLRRRHKSSIFDYVHFKKDIKRADSVLYIGDNAGEIVFDRVLIEEIQDAWPGKDITYVVREKPIINDILMEDAKVCGMHNIVRVISSGSDAPGVILKQANPDFLKLYKNCDIIISKGQGNFETLSSSPRPVYFLFRAKCPVVAEYLGCEEGDIILKNSQKHHEY
ncbi:MAG: DUF89 family protein [Candidatus Omnitrophica bacterium]|nr:DUF89 family protein [Candidatus Omnitrophota bacterium]